MVRYLSAIGMSDYISKKKLDAYIRKCIASPETEADYYSDDSGNDTCIELLAEMDTFGFVLRGRQSGTSVSVFSALPVVRTFRNSMRITSWDVENLKENQPVLCGEDVQFGTPIEVIVTNRHALLTHYLDAPPVIRVNLCGLSTCGQILLNILRTSEDEEAYEEEENWRREMARRARMGDRSAEHSLNEDAAAMEQDVFIRLQSEDVYTILEGLFIPADDSTLGLYMVLGTILRIHKVMNPFTEEWVYEFELNVMGTPYNIYINPKDLEGTPSVGMRFQGTVIMLGEVLWDEQEQGLDS